MTDLVERLQYICRDACRVGIQVRIAVLAIIHITCVVSPAPASVPSEGEKAPLKPIAEWVLRTGNETVIRGHIVRAMNLPDADLAVRQRALNAEGEALTHVCAISTAPGRDELIFFSAVDESDGSAVVWQTSLDGELVSTILFTGGVAARASNLEFGSGFLREKSYFFEKLQAQQNGTPTPVSQSAGVADSKGERQPTSRSPRISRSVLRTERLVIETFPWVLPVIVAVFVFACRQPTRRR